MCYISTMMKLLAGLSFVAISILFSTVLADCKTIRWANYHVYHSKGNPEIIQFKFKGQSLKGVTTKLHCVRGRPSLKLLSDNAFCRKMSINTEINTQGLYCRYKKPTAAPCVKLELKCQ